MREGTNEAFVEHFRLCSFHSLLIDDGQSSRPLRSGSNFPSFQRISGEIFENAKDK